MSTLPTTYFSAQNEMTEIMDAGARSLKQPGLDLLPVKREMLRLPDDHAAIVLDACNLLFAAILSYEAAVWDVEKATSALSLISARIEAGRARGVVEALFFGPTAQLLLTAMDHAPIAFYAMTEASPDLKIIDRCHQQLSK